MNTENPVVSVLVAIYNVEKYLKECLDTILNQTYREFEIILVDDGSTDKSGQIADEYSKIDSRIKVVHQKNGGLSVARNTGLDLATGDYLVFWDSDDFYPPNLIETQLETIKRWHADIAVCRYEYVYKNTHIQCHDKPLADFIEDYSDKKDLALSKNKWQGTSFGGGYVQKKLYKKECLIDKSTREVIHFFEDRRYLEDELFTLKTFKNANRIAFNTQSAFFYRMRGSSVIHDVKFPLRRLRAQILMREQNLLGHKDMLEVSVQFLLYVKLANPKELSPEDKDYFYKAIEWCRAHLDEIMALDLSPLKKIFIKFYLGKWPSFAFKQKLFSLAYPTYRMLSGKGSERDLEFFENN